MKVLLVDDQRMPEWIPHPDEGKATFKDDDITIARKFGHGIGNLLREKWDMLLLDYQLGEAKNGGDVVKWLEDNHDRMPRRIYLVTADADGGAFMMEKLKMFHGAGLLDDYGWLR